MRYIQQDSEEKKEDKKKEKEEKPIKAGMEGYEYHNLSSTKSILTGRGKI